MPATSSAAVALLQLGVLMGVSLLGHAVAVRHLSSESIPDILQGRVLLCTRLRPWLAAASLVLIATGLVLLVG